MNKISFLFIFSAVMIGTFKDHSSCADDTRIGEVYIRDVLILDDMQREKLSRIVEQEPEAGALFDAKLKAAKNLLDLSPRPIEVIYYEGLVNTDSRRIRTVDHLKDMDCVAGLFEIWQVKGDRKYYGKCREYILAWAKTYKPTGNDVNENKLMPLIVAYAAFRKDFGANDKKLVDDWLNDIAGKHMAEWENDSNKWQNNRHTKRIRIIVSIGIALQHKEWISKAWDDIRMFVSKGLYSDGTSYDLHQRDTLTYHISALRPLVDLSLLSIQDGNDLYNWKSPEGASIRRSVEYVIPYANGTKVRQEWKNSKVELDRRRAEAGLEEYRPGRFFDPKAATGLLEGASAFDPSLIPLVAKLMGSSAKKFPSWRTVLNAACVISDN